MFARSLRVGLFLAIRYIRRGNIWASALIVTVMFLTFLNVVVVRGILVGLPVGASISYEHEYAGNVRITPKSDERHIDRTRSIEQLLPAIEGYRAHTARYITSGIVRADYTRPIKAALIPDQVGATVVGINPIHEDLVTNQSSLVVEGRYLSERDTKGILIGHQLLERYAGDTPESGGTPETSGSISDVYPGDTVRLTIGDAAGEYVIVGVVQGKVGENSRRIFMLDSQLRSVIDRSTDKKDEIAIVLDEGYDPNRFVSALAMSGMRELAIVQTARDAQGTFLDDITATFDLLGNSVGFIGIVVAAITVFIVIFIVALNRQKQIGILKGIGINRLAIETSYVLISLSYALAGITLGVVVLYLLIAPYFDANPIDFPFADGVLVAPWDDTLMRSIILLVTTVCAGYVPARLIVQKNTINAILGR